MKVFQFLRATILLAVLLPASLRADDAAWRLPLVDHRTTPIPPAARAPECESWTSLRDLRWYTDVHDLAWIPGTDTVWAVGDATAGSPGAGEPGAPLVCVSHDGGLSWRIESPDLEPGSIPGARASFYKVQFLDDQVGFAAGSAGLDQVTRAVVYRTTDGGASWSLVFEGPPRVGLLRHLVADMVFTDAANGWAVGAIDADGNVAIIHTSDGGDTWTTQPTGIDAAVGEVDFVDSLTGFAVAILGYTLATVDGGAHWTIASQNEGLLSHGALALDFLDAATGFATNVGALVLRTTDAGVNWTIAFDAPRRLWGLAFGVGRDGWAVGEDGTVARTRDGGATWEIMASPSSGADLLVCLPRDAESVWMAGRAEIGFTLDGGETWRSIDGEGYVTNAMIRDLAFTDPDHGWGVGGQGVLIVTADGGESWHHHVGVTAYASAIDFAGTSEGWLAGGNEVWHTQNAGASWYRQATLDTNVIDIQFHDEDLGWVSGVGGRVYRTRDGGTTWEPLATGTNEGLYGIACAGADHVWVVGWNGTVLHTADGGDHWEAQNVPGSQPLYAVCFVDALTGWIAALEAIFATTDGGQTWLTQYVEATEQIADIHFSDALTGIAVGGHVGVCHILVTADGGATWEACGVNQQGQLLDIGQKLHAVQLLGTGEAIAAGQRGWTVRLEPEPMAVNDETVARVSPLRARPPQPNPSSGSARLNFRLGSPADVTIEVFDVAGRRVFHERLHGLSAGEQSYVFGGRNAHGVPLPAGTYLQRLTALGVRQTTKFVVVR